MITLRFRTLRTAALAAGFAVAALHAAGAQEMPKDASGLDAHIRNYILNNPDVVREALLKLEAEEQTANAKRVLRELKADIYDAGSPVIGKPDAAVTIVEFYDYNCPYCRATYPEIKAYLAANPDTNLVLKDIASLGKESEAVARIVLAARKQGTFEALHDGLMTMKGQITEARAIEAAGKLGANVEQLKKDARSSEIGDALTRAQQLAERLNVPATPLYIVGHNGISGAPEDLIAQIKQHADAIRASGCDVC